MSVPQPGVPELMWQGKYITVKFIGFHHTTLYVWRRYDSFLEALKGKDL